MKVFVAGGSGAIGIPLVRALVAAGHDVTALTRSGGKQDALRRIGVTPAIADALDLESLRAALEQARPTHVIHQLTAIPKEGPKRATDMDATNRLRIDGTRNLLDASIRVGARRFIVGSFAAVSASARLPASVDATFAAVRSMESQVLEASRSGSIEGVVLRYGMFYGPDNPATLKMVELVRRRWLPIIRGDSGQLPLIHVDDAVAATVAALDRAPAGAIYDIVDDRAVSLSEVVRTIAAYTHSAYPISVPAWVPRLVSPYMAQMMSLRVPLSNAKAKAELGWRPAHATLREGLSSMFARAA